jgi:hypothetical protein
MTMSDKRSVATDALDTLGTAPLDEHQKRDAIHLAVEPVIAGERLKPGERITVTDGIASSADDDDVLGIVDPFLTRAVRKGQRFWFVMLPRTIKSLRHVWAHPAFPDEVGTSAKQPASKEASERWLREFIDRSNCPSYEVVLGVIARGSALDREYLHFDGSDAHGDIPPEFWDHVEVVLGRKVEHRPAYFSCSC